MTRNRKYSLLSTLSALATVATLALGGIALGGLGCNRAPHATVVCDAGTAPTRPDFSDCVTASAACNAADPVDPACNDDEWCADCNQGGSCQGSCFPRVGRDQRCPIRRIGTDYPCSVGFICTQVPDEDGGAMARCKDPLGGP